MVNVVLFGEIMLRLSPEGFNRFTQAEKFNVNYGGSEANVAFSLSNFGINSIFVTKLPSNDIGQAAFNKLRQYGVDTSKIIKNGERMGIYYLEKGASQRPSKIIYDRHNSSFSQSNVNDFDWDDIFENVDWFHFSGITPALDKNLAEICLIACKKAKNYNITISCDLNYRSKLWSEKEAQKVMIPLMEYVDICIANEEDIEKVLGITARNCDINRGKIDYTSYKNISHIALHKFNFSKIACTLRTSISASDNKWTAILYDGNKFYQSNEYNIHLVDRVGGGDSFASGLIYGFLNNYSNEKTIEFATAASCLKHTIEGDFNIISTTEVLNLVSGNISGRIQR